MRKKLALLANGASLAFPLIIMAVLYSGGVENNMTPTQAIAGVAFIMLTLGIGWSISLINGISTLFTGLNRFFRSNY